MTKPAQRSGVKRVAFGGLLVLICALLFSLSKFLWSYRTQDISKPEAVVLTERASKGGGTGAVNLNVVFSINALHYGLRGAFGHQWKVNYLGTLASPSEGATRSFENLYWPFQWSLEPRFDKTLPRVTLALTPDLDSPQAIDCVIRGITFHILIYVEGQVVNPDSSLGDVGSGRELLSESMKMANQDLVGEEELEAQKQKWFFKGE